MHEHLRFTCIGEEDVDADLSCLAWFRVLAELLQGRTFGPWNGNLIKLAFIAHLSEWRVHEHCMGNGLKIDSADESSN